MDEDLKKKIKELEQRIEGLEKFFSNIEDFKIEESFPDDEDELYIEVLNMVVNMQSVSISFLQRRFKIGFNHALDIVEKLENDGVLEKGEGAGERKVLINFAERQKEDHEKKPN